jgi:hypothetical protein
MIRRRTSISASSRWAVPLLALAGLGGCTAYATKKDLPIDCTVQNAYDIDNIDTEFSMSWFSHDSTTDAGWTSGDAGPPPNGILTKAVPIPDGALCGDTMALHVASGNYYNDWGSVFGFYSFGKKVETTREGLSFWARAPGNTNKSLTILFDDPNTYHPGAMCTFPGEIIPPGDAGCNCTTYCTPDGGVASTGPITDGNGNVLSSGTSTAPLPANACGNSYFTQVVLTADWRFYTIPFAAFQQQTHSPDKVPNSDLKQTGTAPGTYLLTSSIWNMTFRTPKAAPFDLWFDRIGFYGPKGPGDGGGQ